MSTHRFNPTPRVTELYSAERIRALRSEQDAAIAAARRDRHIEAAKAPFLDLPASDETWVAMCDAAQEARAEYEARVLTDRLAAIRRELLIPTDYCVGCWLGDAAPEMHDYAYGCDYGLGAGGLDD